MYFRDKWLKGTLVQRYKRFLADVRLENGEIVTAHTANPGSMKGLVEPGNIVYLSYHDLPGRKLKYSWEVVQVGTVAVGVNTYLPNRLVEEGIQQGLISELQGYGELQREVKYGKNSRIDLLLSDKDKPKCFVEVKSVTLLEGEVAFFPDAVTSRGRKHLEELTHMVRQGHRAVSFYLVQRGDGKWVAPADHIDPSYGKALRLAAGEGVEILAYRAKVRPQEIVVTQRLPFRLEKI